MRDSAAVLFLDLQDEIVKNSRTVAFETLGPRIVMLAKLATIHHLPAFISCVAQAGSLVADVAAVLPDNREFVRHTTSALADDEFNAALMASGPKQLILCGVTSEVVVQRTALEALGAGYDVQIAVDACGGIDARTEDAAWQRIMQAGGVLTSTAMVAAELAGDFRSELGQATFGVLRELLTTS